MRHRLSVSAAISFVLVGLASAQTLPATSPNAADYSTPKATIRSFLTATDEAGMRAALKFSEDTHAEAETFLGVMVATTRLQKLAAAQYGAISARYFGSSTKEQTDTRLQSLEKATETISSNGMQATVVLPANEAARQSGSTILLHKDADNQWKIDASSMFGIPDTSKEQLAKRIAVAKALTQVTEQMMKDLPKFSSPADAFQEFWKRLNDAARNAAGLSK